MMVSETVVILTVEAEKCRKLDVGVGMNGRESRRLRVRVRDASMV